LEEGKFWRRQLIDELRNSGTEHSSRVEDVRWEKGNRLSRGKKTYPLRPGPLRTGKGRKTVKEKLIDRPWRPRQSSPRSGKRGNLDGGRLIRSRCAAQARGRWEGREEKSSTLRKRVVDLNGQAHSIGKKREGPASTCSNVTKNKGLCSRIGHGIAELGGNQKEVKGGMKFISC